MAEAAEEHPVETGTASAANPPAPAPAPAEPMASAADDAGQRAEDQREKRREHARKVLADSGKAQEKPADEPQPEPSDQGRTPPKTATAAAPAESQPKPNEPAEDAHLGYQGLDRKTWNTLSQAQIIKDFKADEWNKLPADIKRALLAHARSVVSERTKQFEAQRRAQQGEPEPQAAVARQEAPAPRTERADPQSPPARAAIKDLAGPKLKKVAELYGLDAEQSILDAMEAVSQENDRIRAEDNARHNAALEETKKTIEQMRTVQKAAVQANYDRIEHATREQVAKDLPVYGTDDESWSEIRTEALDDFNARRSANLSADWAYCLTKAARNKGFADHFLEAQRQLANASKKAIRGTPERPESVVRDAPKPKSRREAAELALRLLQDNKDVEEVRRALR